MFSRARAIDYFLYPLPLVAFVLIWHFCTNGNEQTQFIFSSPAQVWSAFVRVVQSGELLRYSAVTVFEALCGFVIGTTCGAAIGLSLWYCRLVARIAKPYITALATIPIF